MSRLSVFAAAAALLVVATTPAVFAKEHHHVRKAMQYISIDRLSRGGPYAGPRPPVHYDGTPSYNVHSKFGGVRSELRMPLAKQPMHDQDPWADLHWSEGAQNSKAPMNVGAYPPCKVARIWDWDAQTPTRS
jgi:hypothetical protein